MGKASRRDQRDQRDRGDHRLRRQATGPQAHVRAAFARLTETRDGWRLSLGAALALGYTLAAVELNEDRAPDWYAGLDPVDLVFLGLLIPEEVDEETVFANCRDAWVNAVVTGWGPGPLDDLIDMMAQVSARTAIPIDDPIIALELAAALVEVPSALRPLPEALMPRVCLQGHRAVALPTVTLHSVPAGAAELVAAFRAGLAVELANDGTVRDVLREGVHILERAAAAPLPAALLAAALHVASAADNRTPVGDLVVRTPAWVTGLDPASPLVPVADVVLSASEAGESFDDTLARLLDLPEMAEPVLASDRHYHSMVGYRASALALGRPAVTEVLTASGTLARLAAPGAALIRSQQRRFDDTFGPGARGPLFFDPHAAIPAQLDADTIRSAAGEIVDALDLSEASRYAFAQTGLLPPAPGATWSPGRLDELLAARAEWGRAHGVGPADLDASWQEDLAKSAVFDATITVLQAAADPEFGADMVDHLEHGHAMVGETLVGLLDTVGDRVLDDGVLARAVEYAHAWQGAALGDRVRVEAQLALRGHPPADPPAVLALLAAIQSVA